MADETVAISWTRIGPHWPGTVCTIRALLISIQKTRVVIIQTFGPCGSFTTTKYNPTLINMHSDTYSTKSTIKSGYDLSVEAGEGKDLNVLHYAIQH